MYQELLEHLRNYLRRAVKYGLERLNAEVAAWMRGAHMADGTKSRPPYLAMGGPDSVMWNRQFGHERFPTMHQRFRACMDLDATLRLLGARQLIVGHTPQVRPTSYIDDVLFAAALIGWLALQCMLPCRHARCFDLHPLFVIIKSPLEQFVCNFPEGCAS